MSTKLCMLVALPALGVAFIGGSVHSPSSVSVAVGPVRYRAQSSPLPESLQNQPNPGAYLLDRAIEHCKKIKWLRADVRIVRHDGPMPFSTEGKLLRGDNHCVHLDLSMKTMKSKDALQVKMIGDGFLLSEYRKHGDRTAKITTLTMPCRESVESNYYSPSREKTLADMGCAGPRPLVEEIRALASDLEASRGEFEGMGVYQITGVVDPEHPRLQAKRAAKFKADRCCILLDAETLWPLRIEWRLGESLVLETTYRNARLHQPLSYDECVEFFTLREEPASPKRR